METIEEPKSRQSSSNGNDVEDDPLFDRHDVEEWIWEFAVDTRSVFDPK
jgi:hypothetical protein